MWDFGTFDEICAAIGTLGAWGAWTRGAVARLAAVGRTLRSCRLRYRDMHAALEIAGRLVDTELTERRKISFALISSDGSGEATTATLVSAY